MLLRPAAPEDVDALVALVESAYRGESSRAGWTTEADLLDGQRTDPDEVTETLPHLAVAEVDGDLVGCCALVPRADHGYFGMFAVRPGLQGGGVGSALLEHAEKRAASLGLTRVDMTVLSTRAELIAYYQRRGYVDTGDHKPFPYGEERFGQPRRDDLEFVVLSKLLTTS
ncbi:MAG: GNAT family N-acetyltransferase [Mycobacteriales bacterium]